MNMACYLFRNKSGCPDQNTCPEDGNQNPADISGSADTDQIQDKTTHNTADNTENDIDDQTVFAVHNLCGSPTCDRTADNCDNK